VNIKLKYMKMKSITGIIGIIVAIHVLSGNMLVAQSADLQKSEKTVVKLMTYNLNFAGQNYSSTGLHTINLKLLINFIESQKN